MSCISLKHWSFSSHPNSDIQWLLLFIKAFCCKWELSGCDSWMRMRCGIGDQLWHCSNLKTEHKDKLAKKLLSPSLFYSSLNTNTDSPRNNNTRVKERCLSAHGVILCHCVTVMFRPAWLVSVRGTWGAHEWHTHTLSSTCKRTQVMQGFLLTAPVPYRHHPLLLASNPGIKKKGCRERVGQWRAW